MIWRKPFIQKDPLVIRQRVFLYGCATLMYSCNLLATYRFTAGRYEAFVTPNLFSGFADSGSPRAVGQSGRLVPGRLPMDDGYGDMSTVGTPSVWYAGDTLVGGQPAAQVLRRSIIAASVFPGGVPLPGTLLPTACRR